jgi:O-antigen ligase
MSRFRRIYRAGRLPLIHTALGVFVVAFYAWHFHNQPPLWAALWCVGLSLAVAAVARPELGLAAYVLTFYATPRYTQIFVGMARSRLLDWEVLFALTGGALWLWRSRQPFRLYQPLVLLGTGLFAWGCLVTAIPRAEPARPVDPVHHAPIYFVHAFVLMIIASQTLRRPAAALKVILILCAGLVARVRWQGFDGLRLEGDIGPLVLMILPLTVVLAQVAEDTRVRLLLSVAALGALATAAVTYNRASAVTFVVVAIALLWHNRRRVWLVLATGCSLAGATFWFRTTPYWSRFLEAWGELHGTRTGSVTERFELWRAGFALTTDHPVIGIGPGRYAAEVATYAPQLHGMVAHNSYVQMAAETGLPGLGLYLALFLGAVYVARGIYRRAPMSQAGVIATGAQASLLAYLAVSLFISRNDMVLAYMVVGWISALSLTPAVRPAAAPQQSAA